MGCIRSEQFVALDFVCGGAQQEHESKYNNDVSMSFRLILWFFALVFYYMPCSVLSVLFCCRLFSPPILYLTLCLSASVAK
jgi:hypothetical protein